MAEEVSAKQLRSLLERLTFGTVAVFLFYRYSLNFNFPQQFWDVCSPKSSHCIRNKKILSRSIFRPTRCRKRSCFSMLSQPPRRQTIIVACTMPWTHPVKKTKTNCYVRGNFFFFVNWLSNRSADRENKKVAGFISYQQPRLLLYL